MVRSTLTLLAIAAALVAVTSADAQNYPSKAVRLIVPFPPGGSTDTLARALSMRLADVWGQQIVIDNRPGASGIIGTELGAKAAPDGYTLLMGSGGPLTINPSLYKTLPYDPLKDFAPITNVAAVPNVLVLHPSVPATTVKQLIAIARAHPNELNFASTGNASPGQLAGELLKTMTGVKMVHIPCKGSAPAVAALISGEVSLTFTTTPAVLPQAKAGRLRIIAVTTLTRVAEIPDVPTVAESGLPGYEAVSWFGLVGPAALAPDLITKIHADAMKILNSTEMRDRIASHGAAPIANTPEQFRAQIREDLIKWARIVKMSGAKAD